MGPSQSNTISEDPGIPMDNVKISPDQENARKSKEAPSTAYATPVQQRPRLLPSVQRVLAEQKSALSQSKIRGEALPIYELNQKKGFYYEGQWAKGKQNGRGKVYSKDGSFFDGYFENGKANCPDGLFIFPDGSYYRGSFKDHQFSGKGKYLNAYNKTAYEGEWLADLPHGNGVEKFSNQTRYEGYFTQGKKNGHGRLTWKNGMNYQGQFKDGNMHGKGRLTKGEAHFEGTFQNGLKKEGKLRTQFGHYFGKFENGEMHDPAGKFEWIDGKIYEGGFAFGQLHGRGNILYPNKQQAFGEWERGENLQINEIGKEKIK